MKKKRPASRPWHPNYPRPKDRRVGFVECEVQAYLSNRRPVVALSDYRLDAPACFWTDDNRICLRINWGQWCSVQQPNPSFAAVLRASRNCQVMMTLDNEIIEETVPVFHVAELPPELFPPKDSPDESESAEQSAAVKKREAISNLQDAVPFDLDAMAFHHVRVDGQTMDLVVSSDDRSVIFSVFPEDEDFSACPQCGGTESGKLEPGELSGTELDELEKHRRVLLKIEPSATLSLAIVASVRTLESMRMHWADELEEKDIELVEYPEFEEFLRRHFPSIGDDEDGDGEGEE